jgi:hypothetical protein
LPTEIPVITPLLVMVATPGLELIQFPPDAGKKVVADPIQTELSPDNNMVGFP